MSRSCRTSRGRIATGRPSRTSKTPALRPPPCGWGIYLAQGVRFLSGDESVEIVPQEIGAVDAAVAVEYSEVGWLLPISHVLRL